MSENSIIPYNQLKEMAADVAKSNLFGVKTPEQAMGLMLLSQAEGIHPMRAIQDYHIIEGKPSKKPEAMLRDFIAAGGSVKWVQYDEKVVEAIFAHLSGGTVTVKWTIEMAAAAGLAKKAVWINYPRSMLRNRTIAEGVRAVYPAATAGMYTPEETEMINVTPDPAAQVQSGTLATAEELKARALQRAQQQQKEEPVIIEQTANEGDNQGDMIDESENARSITPEEAKELIKAFSDAGQDIKQYLSDLSTETGRAIKDLKGITFGEYKEAKIKLGRA